MSKSATTIERQLTNGCDGPLTPFVILTRAIRFARSTKGESFSNDDIANGLYGALAEYGWIDTSIDAMATGS